MPLYRTQTVNADTKLALWKITEAPEELLAELQLDEEELQTYQSLKGLTRQLHWLAGRVLLRSLINTPEHIKIAKDAQDKPFTVDFSYHFSLSHSLDFAGAILSRSVPVGLDIEVIKEKIVRVVDKFLSTSEQRFISQGNDRIPQLYACWSAKEALYKLYGQRGLSLRNHIELLPFAYSAELTLDAKILRDDCPKLFRVHCREVDGYMMAFVVDH